MTHTDDLTLLHAYANGDEAAFALLIARHSGWIFAAARRRLNDEHLADDARQTVFLLLAERANDLLRSDGNSLSAWLFHVMHFTCLNIRRTRIRLARHEAAARALPRPENESDNSMLSLLEDTISQLPPRDREAVVRRFYQRQTFAEVGDALNISEDAARKRVTRTLVLCRVSMSLDGVDAKPVDWLDRHGAIADVPASCPFLQAESRISNLLQKGLGKWLNKQKR